MSDWFIGEIRVFPYDFVPVEWLACDGRELKMKDYQALAAVIGARFGGDGRTTFKLPDLRGRVAVGASPTEGGSVAAVGLGETVGSESVTLAVGTLAAHTHQLGKKTIPGGFAAKTSKPSTTSDLGGLQPSTGSTFESFASGLNADTSLDPRTLSPAGAATVTPHENRQPFLFMRFAIATEGEFPMQP